VNKHQNIEISNQLIITKQKSTETISERTVELTNRRTEAELTDDDHDEHNDHVHDDDHQPHIDVIRLSRGKQMLQLFMIALM
jgi:hypothetical protein